MANEQPNKDMQEQFERLRQAISADIDQKISAAIDKKFDAATQEIKGLMQVHFEGMQHLVKVAADGYGGTLESIERRLSELSTKWDTKITDHDRVLQNHAGRLAKLERR